MILALDPGSEKCGLAALDPSGNVLEKKVIAREDVKGEIPPFLSKYRTNTLIVGKSSYGKEIEKEIYRMGIQAHIIFVSEKYSTLEARKRYWKENRPAGLWRFVPSSLLTPPVPVDDYAAVILGERYLKG